MNKLISIITLLLISIASVQSQSSDDVKGVWMNEEKTAKIKIFKTTKGSYAGKIIWIEDSDKEDVNNPDKDKRSRKILGLVIVRGFKWSEAEKRWEEGTIYDPNKGKTYSCYMYFDMKNKNRLNLRGYIMGMKWLGRTSEWTRVK